MFLIFFMVLMISWSSYYCRVKETKIFLTGWGWMGVIGCGDGVVYLTSLGHPTDIGLQLGKACYPCSR